MDRFGRGSLEEEELFEICDDREWGDRIEKASSNSDKEENTEEWEECWEMINYFFSLFWIYIK